MYRILLVHCEKHSSSYYYQPLPVYRRGNHEDRERCECVGRGNWGRAPLGPAWRNREHLMETNYLPGNERTQWATAGYHSKVKPRWVGSWRVCVCGGGKQHWEQQGGPAGAEKTFTNSSQTSERWTGHYDTQWNETKWCALHPATLATATLNRKVVYKSSRQALTVFLSVFLTLSLALALCAHHLCLLPSFKQTCINHFIFVLYIYTYNDGQCSNGESFSISLTHIV